ncbi:MAG TPA: hypothetical protein VK735_39810 [Pseudonocardia sp.]|uniref:hypothetical protein n=1 Tax=Pseudonocardia sp. TaxID=60912 RepID=UPI002B62C5E0|nr:hypothetical protein [Pseudonocardia sp.]HTF53630.1 hypothetical protein [Pseudonocardia sp.]
MTAETPDQDQLALDKVIRQSWFEMGGGVGPAPDESGNGDMQLAFDILRSEWFVGKLAKRHRDVELALFTWLADHTADPTRTDTMKWLHHYATRVLAGHCPHSGDTIVECKQSDLCDCFDFPAEVWARQIEKE